MPSTKMKIKNDGHHLLIRAYVFIKSLELLFFDEESLQYINYYKILMLSSWKYSISSPQWKFLIPRLEPHCFEMSPDWWLYYQKSYCWLLEFSCTNTYTLSVTIERACRSVNVTIMRWYAFIDSCTRHHYREIVPLFTLCRLPASNSLSLVK